MRVGKKALSLVLSISLVLGTFSGTAAFAAGAGDAQEWDSQFDSGYQDSANTYHITDSNFTLPKDSGEVEVQKVLSDSGNVVIPAQVVCEKADSPFKDSLFHATAVEPNAFDGYNARSVDASILRPGADENLDGEPIRVQLAAAAAKDGGPAGYVSLEAPRSGPITVRAVPADGYQFEGWYEETKCVSEEASYALPEERDYDLTANFVEGSGEATLDYADYHRQWGSYYYGDQNSYPLNLDESVTFTWNAGGDSLTWSSTQPSVATVDPKTGKVTPQAVGRTFIKAVNSNGGAVYFKVTVQNGAVTGAKEYTLTKVSCDSSYQ